jgi:hypothetical protein
MTDFINPSGHNKINGAQFGANQRPRGNDASAEQQEAAPVFQPSQTPLSADQIFKSMQQNNFHFGLTPEYLRVSQHMNSFAAEFPPEKFDVLFGQVKSTLQHELGYSNDDLAEQVVANMIVGQPQVNPGKA